MGLAAISFQTSKGATMAGIPRHQGRADPKIVGSDTSDTISDRPGESTDSDADGTGERPTVGMLRPPRPEFGTDRTVNQEEAGLGSGLDEAEEARLGVDEELQGDEPEKPVKKRKP
jgi:hypothetical protein